MNREEELYAAALAIPAAERDAFLSRACAGDAALRDRIDQLLAAHRAADDFFALPDPERPNQLHEPRAGDRIGRYRLLQKIGEGGCGVVWMAGQDEPVRRRVALKVIKLGMDTKAVIARFEAERQALALMDHPHIAKVHDAGSTEAGRPYFVMELVRGTPITRYCDEHQLTPANRLELFIKVCQAVQHAHQKGIIHRDLKPSNILVTVNDGQATPKVIDFGIAKATQGRLTDTTVFTAFEQFIGTPVYMSPEQAEMTSLDIDTRSDVYSLGVLLYELLTGRPPFDPKALARASVEHIRREIRETEPPRPSARWRTLGAGEQTTVAARRGTAPAALAGLLRSDLDWIVMRCLEKDRARRYETANGLAMDLQRFLRHEPVTARPPSTAYLLQKLIRRHRFGFAAAAAMLVVIIAGALTTAAQATRALRAERKQGELREAARQSQVKELAARNAAEAEKLQREKQRWTREHLLPEIKRLQLQGDIAAAYDRAVEAERLLYDDADLADLMRSLSTTITVQSEPPGAEVFVKHYREPASEWQLLGTTPLSGVRLARSVYRWQGRKAGYETRERAGMPGQVNLPLNPLGTTPPGMIHIPAGSAPADPETDSLLVVTPTAASSLRLSEFYIDQFEVTNRQFKEFINQGGYSTPDWWQVRLERDGRELLWREAMGVFRDSTGRPGPLTWAEGTYPHGKEEHPVGGVSWYEAAAYAAWAGKRLPSLRHWKRAAVAFPEPLVQLSNFSGQEPAPVGRYSGVSSWGLSDVAGNVKEWCWNEAAPGTRYLMGGSSREPVYIFRHDDARSPWDRSETHGFRCIKLAPGTSDPPEIDNAIVPRRRDYSVDRPASEETYRALKAHYAYDRGPLNAQVETLTDPSFPGRVERVSLDAAYGKARIPVKIYLPVKVSPPYQTVLYYPSSDAFANRDQPNTRFLQFMVESGRAVVFPVYDGTYERGEGSRSRYLDNNNLFTDFVVHSSKDLGRTIDYLETRTDIKHDALAFWGMSLGGSVGVMLVALEPRIKACALISGGINPREVPPHVDQVYFAPRITCPTLMINGRYDFIFPEPAQRQLFRLLGTPPEHKRHLVLDRGHVVRGEETQKEILAWLDRYFGPVK